MSLLLSPGRAPTHTNAHIHAQIHTHTLRKLQLFSFIFFFCSVQVIRTFPLVHYLPRAGEKVGQGL